MSRHFIKLTMAFPDKDEKKDVWINPLSITAIFKSKINGITRSNEEEIYCTIVEQMMTTNGEGSYHVKETPEVILDMIVQATK